MRIGGSGDLPCPLWRVQRHVGGGVRKVYFLHAASMWPHLVRISLGIRADTVATIIMRIACRGAGFLHSTVSTQDEGQEAHPLGAFYLFGALGKNSLSAAAIHHQVTRGVPRHDPLTDRRRAAPAVFPPGARSSRHYWPYRVGQHANADPHRSQPQQCSGHLNSVPQATLPVPVCAPGGLHHHCEYHSGSHSEHAPDVAQSTAAVAPYQPQYDRSSNLTHQPRRQAAPVSNAVAFLTDGVWSQASLSDAKPLIYRVMHRQFATSVLGSSRYVKGLGHH